MLSPRLATYKALPGGATVVSDASGALGTPGVEGLEVGTNFGCAVWAEATGTAAISKATKPKAMNRILTTDGDKGPRRRKVFSVKTAVFRDATCGQISRPDNVGSVPCGAIALRNFQVVANYFSFPKPPPWRRPFFRAASGI